MKTAQSKTPPSLANSHTRRNIPQRTAKHAAPRANQQQRAKTYASQTIKLLRDTAHKTFICPYGSRSRDENMQALRKLVELINSDLLALPNQIPGHKASTVQYYHVCGGEGDLFSIGVFVLPKGSSIPLHDHPEMTVISKLLFGKLHMVSYDWHEADESQVEGFEGFPARLVYNCIRRGPAMLQTLFPTYGGNLHQFTALEDSAILDVLGPPYHRQQRPCTYYNNVGPLSPEHYAKLGIPIPGDIPPQLPKPVIIENESTEPRPKPTTDSLLCSTAAWGGSDALFMLQSTRPPSRAFGGKH